MIIIYDAVNVNGHLACGLVEKVNLSDEQKLELEQINFLIEALRKDIGAFYKKLNVISAEEAIQKAEGDAEVDEQIRQWMEKVFVKQNQFIVNMIDDFNRKYVPNYNKLVPKKDANKGEIK